MVHSKIFLVLLAFLCGAFCTLTTKDGIYNVTEDNFEEFIDFAKSRNATFYLKFFTPLCPHCQTLKPIYIEAAKQLQNDPDGLYILGEVNTMIQEKLGKHFQIRGLPTIFVFSPLNDYNPVQYNKNRTVFDLVTEIELASGLITKELPTYADFEHRLAMRDENMLLGVFKDNKNQLFSEMQAIKEDFKFVRMYYTFNLEEYRQKLNLPAGDNFVLMFHNKKFIESGDEAFAIYTPEKYTTLRNFVIREYPYKVEILNDKVESIYNMRPLPRAVLFTPFTNRSKEVLQLALQLKPLGKKFDGKFNIYLQDPGIKLTRKCRMDTNATFMIFDLDKQKHKYRYPGKAFDGKLDINALIEFTQMYLDGHAPRYICGVEPNPDDLDEPVYPVVARTFDGIVNDPNKHVFLRFYDKMVQRYAEQFQMRKEWWKVGRNYTNNSRDIFIGEIEVNDNDVPEEYLKHMSEGKYYFLFTKKYKEPFIYTGRVNATDLIKFAEEHITKEDPIKQPIEKGEKKVDL